MVGDVIGESHAISCHELHKKDIGIVLTIVLTGYPRLAVSHDFSTLRFHEMILCRSLKCGQTFDAAVAVKARHKSLTSQ